MVIELTLMGIAAAGIIALLVHKHVELSRGVESRAKEVMQRAEPMLQDIHHTTGRFLSYFTLHNAILTLNYAFVHAVRFCMNISHKIHITSSKIVEKASQKTEDLSKGGAASFYLKQIKDSAKPEDKVE